MTYYYSPWGTQHTAFNLSGRSRPVAAYRTKWFNDCNLFITSHSRLSLV